MNKIESNIPIPEQVRGRPAKYQFADMNIGDSFFVKGNYREQIKILTCAKRLLPKKFITKKVTEKAGKGYRCWRVT